VLTDAILHHIDPFTTTYLSAPFRGPSTDPYLIQTDTHTYTGRTPLDKATAESDNTVFVRLTLDLGAQSVADTAHLLGVRSPLQPVPTIGLGVNPVSPLEMASAYATIADQGTYHQPYAIESVTFPDGRTDRSWPTHRGKQVIAKAVAYQVSRVLEEVISHGTGTAADPGRPAAGKTGTTSSLADAWFDGYTPDLAAAVWVGYPQARIPMKHVHGIEVFGGTFPARIWRAFVGKALREVPARNFETAGNVTWRPWCGRFQYARSYSDAHSFVACPGKKTKKTTTVTTTTSHAQTTSTTVQTTGIHSTTYRLPPKPTTTYSVPTTTAPPPTSSPETTITTETTTASTETTTTTGP
jgi:membrane peptidoglycan carboxypeptidase